MPLIGRPMLSTMLFERVGRNDRADLPPRSCRPRARCPRSACRSARARATRSGRLDRREEVAAKKGDEQKRSRDGCKKAGDEQPARRERGMPGAAGRTRAAASKRRSKPRRKRVNGLRVGGRRASPWSRRLMGQQKARHRIHERARKDVGGDQREHDRLRHRPKQIAGDAAEPEHRHEHDADAQQRDGRGNDDLPRAVHDRALDVLALLEMRVDVLDRDGRVVDQDADGERKAAERHHVDRLAERRQAAMSEVRIASGIEMVMISVERQLPRKIRIIRPVRAAGVAPSKRPTTPPTSRRSTGRRPAPAACSAAGSRGVWAAAP